MDSQRPSRKINLRINKFLADCGLGSRRACEALIREGRVRINGLEVQDLGTRVDADNDQVEVSGIGIVAPQRHLYLMLNKPRGIVCTSHDPQGRPTVLDLIEGVQERLYTIGRLDCESEGLILLTNDGQFAQQLAHPRHEVHKVYRALVDHALTREQEAQLLRGVQSRGERLSVLHLEAERGHAGLFGYRITLGEGRNRHIRRMFEVFDITVRRLRRVAVGPLKLGNLKPGSWRELTEAERTSLMQAHV